MSTVNAPDTIKLDKPEPVDNTSTDDSLNKFVVPLKKFAFSDKICEGCKRATKELVTAPLEPE